MKDAAKMLTGNWQDNWFVKNIGYEIPLVGPFLKETEIARAIRSTLKSTCMLVGGVTFMITDPFDSMAMGEVPATSAAKMAGGMTLGMMPGNIAYNILDSATTSAYNCAVSFYQQKTDDTGKYSTFEMGKGHDAT